MHNNNTSGNISKDNDELNTLVYKNIYFSLFFKETTACCSLIYRWRDYILRERTSSSHIFFREPGSANACTALQARQTRPDRLRVPRSTAILSTLPNLTAWFSSRGLLPVTHLLYPSVLIMLSCLLITTWQLVKAHGVTWNESKIHVMLYNNWTLPTQDFVFNKTV